MGHHPGPQKCKLHPKGLKNTSTESAHVSPLFASNSPDAPSSHLGQPEAQILPSPRPLPTAGDFSGASAGRKPPALPCELQRAGKEVEGEKSLAMPACCAPPRAEGRRPGGGKRVCQWGCHSRATVWDKGELSLPSKLPFVIQRNAQQAKKGGVCRTEKNKIIRRK